MSYPKDLDEESDLALVDELLGRLAAMAACCCTYCHQAYDECRCRYGRTRGRAGRCLTDSVPIATAQAAPGHLRAALQPEGGTSDEPS